MDEDHLRNLISEKAALIAALNMRVRGLESEREALKAEIARLHRINAGEV